MLTWETIDLPHGIEFHLRGLPFPVFCYRNDYTDGVNVAGEEISCKEWCPHPVMIDNDTLKTLTLAVVSARLARYQEQLATLANS